MPNTAAREKCPDCDRKVIFVGGSQREIGNLRDRVNKGEKLSRIIK